MTRLQAVITHANFKWLLVARRLEQHRRPESVYFGNVPFQIDTVEEPAEVGVLLDPHVKRVDDVDDVAEGVYVSHMIANCLWMDGAQDRKSTRLNSSHVAISYAVFCLKKK